MPKTRKTRAAGKLAKGLSIDEALFKKVKAVASMEQRSFAFIVRRAIERDLANPSVTGESIQHPEQGSELIDITEVAKRLKLSRRRNIPMGSLCMNLQRGTKAPPAPFAQRG